VADPQPSPNFHRLALLVDNARPELAQRELRRHLAEFPNEARLHAMMSLTFIKQSRAAEAMANARVAITLDPYDPLSNQAWAAAHAMRVARRGGVAVVREAMQRGLTNATMFALLAQATLNTRFFGGRAALEAAETGLLLDPEHHDCLLLRAQALVRLRRFAEARNAADEALRVAPEAALSHAVRGFVEAASLKRQRAYPYFIQALRLDPNEPFTHARLENERLLAAMVQQLAPVTWPLRIACALALLAVVPLGLLAGHPFLTVFSAFYLCALHPDVLARMCPPEIRQLFSAQGALRRSDVWTARGTILWCAVSAVVMCTSATEWPWGPFFPAAEVGQPVPPSSNSR
jgi:tetratricopeptide (TPR) repeat protein